MSEILDGIISSRLVNIDKNTPVNIDWLLNLCRFYSIENIEKEELILYLQSKGYVFFNNHTSKKEKKEVNHIEQEIILVEGNLKSHRKPFNPSEFVNEIGRDIDLSIYTHKDNDYLIQKYRETNESKYLDRIIEVNTKLVQSIAKKYISLGHLLEFDDLVQIGIIGLYKAIEKFDESLGYNFSTYATWWIKQRLYRDIMDFGFTIRLPVHIHEQLTKLKKLQSESIEIRRKVDVEWIAHQMGIKLEKYNELIKIDYNFYNLASLNTLVSPDGEDTELLDLIAPSPDLEFNMQLYHFEEPTQMFTKMATAELMEELLGSLTDKEANILRKRMGFYGQKQITLEEIGIEYNVTRERIRQIEAKALSRLKKIIELKKWDKYDLML